MKVIKAGRILDNFEQRSTDAQNIINTKSGFVDRYSIVILSVIVGALICILLQFCYVEKIEIRGEITFKAEFLNAETLNTEYSKNYIGIQFFEKKEGIGNGSPVELYINDNDFHATVKGRLIVLDDSSNSNLLNAIVEVNNESRESLKRIKSEARDLVFNGSVEKIKVSLFWIVYSSLSRRL